MPVTFQPTTVNGVKHLLPVFWCEECGQPASFGEGVALSKAKTPDDPAMGRWFCGWVNGKPQCVGKGRAG